MPLLGTRAGASARGYGQLSGKKLVYSIGDTGPGGGIIFYVSSGGFLSGPTMALVHNYLEASPANWDGSGADPSLLWSGNNTIAVGTSSFTAIGTGYKNTLAIVANNSTANRASTASRAYNGASLTDWFLPSKDEVQELYINRSYVGGYDVNYYWSSTERAATNTNAYTSDYNGGIQAYTNKGGGYPVRPIRSF